MHRKSSRYSSVGWKRLKKGEFSLARVGRLKSPTSVSMCTRVFFCLSAALDGIKSGRNLSPANYAKYPYPLTLSAPVVVFFFMSHSCILFAQPTTTMTTMAAAFNYDQQALEPLQERPKSFDGFHWRWTVKKTEAPYIIHTAGVRIAECTFRAKYPSIRYVCRRRLLHRSPWCSNESRAEGLGEKCWESRIPIA